MSSRLYLKHTVSTTPPTGQLGDEWFDPSANKLYKLTAVLGLPQWTEVGVAPVANIFSLSNVNISGKATLTGSSTSLALNPSNLVENFTTVGTAIATTYTYNAATQTIVYVTANSTGNFTVNITGSTTSTLNNLLSVGQAITMVLMVTHSTTAYYVTGITVDGISVTAKWQGGTAPSSGNASAIDSYTFTVMKTANATFTVLSALTKFA